MFSRRTTEAVKDTGRSLKTIVTTLFAAVALALVISLGALFVAVRHA